MNANPRVERRIRLASALVLVGLVIEAVTLRILHPLSFVAFAAFGALAIAAGIIVYLFAVLRASEPDSVEPRGAATGQGRAG